VFIYGISGCGKSLTAKSAPIAFGGIPLLKMDLGALKGKFVGESEANIRKALKTIEAIGRCVVWIDEIEKALQGATSGSADGGTSADQVGTILTWMQERTSEAFVIATANDPSSLPPELLRKGRWDEVFFVDLPTAEERKQVAKAALKANGRADADIDLDLIAEVTSDFTGAEIAALIPEALFNSFADGEREITTQDIVEVAKPIIPLARSSQEKIEALRKKAQGTARYATSQELEAPTKARGRAIEIA
jgi:SpoVK/Ycf46/Vps4 family AAA+-type ATPase